MAKELAEAGWVVQESQENRPRLSNSSGNYVTVVTGDFLSEHLIGGVNEEPQMDFVICADPVLIVPHLDARFILEGLR